MTVIAASPKVVPEPPLITRLVDRYGATRLDSDGFEAFIGGAGPTVLFFTENPLLIKEVLDVAVILPEIVQALSQRPRIGVLPPALADAKAPLYGVRRWPALVFLRDGGWLGNIEGLLDWADYLARVNEVLAGPVRPLPQKVIALAVAGARSCS